MKENPVASGVNVATIERYYPKISVVIPARNEAQNLVYVLPHIPSIVGEVILVDGHSTDNTIAKAEQLLPTIKIIKQTGMGKGDALRQGFAACSGDIIVILDADGSIDPRELPQFVEALIDGNDFAKGSRFLKGGGSQDHTLWRYFGNYVLSQIAKMLFRAQFTDICYGYAAFWKYCLDSIDIDCDGFEVEALLLTRAHKAGFKIVEIPSFEQPRIYGASKLHSLRDGWRMLKMIVKERLTKNVQAISAEVASVSAR